MMVRRVCSCGKLLKSEDEAQVHATRSGHTNFSESVEEVKPLTEEEKKAQLAKYYSALLIMLSTKLLMLLLVS